MTPATRTLGLAVVSVTWYGHVIRSASEFRMDFLAEWWHWFIFRNVKVSCRCRWYSIFVVTKKLRTAAKPATETGYRIPYWTYILYVDERKVSPISNKKHVLQSNGRTCFIAELGRFVSLNYVQFETFLAADVIQLCTGKGRNTGGDKWRCPPFTVTYLRLHKTKYTKENKVVNRNQLSITQLSHILSKSPTSSPKKPSINIISYNHYHRPMH